jgi:outer membrane protein OmpA-like peptidoglycan-associated protein
LAGRLVVVDARRGAARPRSAADRLRRDSDSAAGFDEAAITPDSQDILAKAARDIAAIETLDADHAAGTAPHERGRKDIHSPSATVVAYADTAGSKAYNLRLARRRAKATADAMIALGVPAAGIAIRCKGESDPAVDTGDEVREPLNRRVTIHISAGGV